MEENREMLELLRQIEKTNRQKRNLAGVICGLMLLAAASSVIVCVAVLRTMPQFQILLTELESMVSAVDVLAVSAQDSLAQTMEKVNLIDFATLNRAIEDLAQVIEPLARWASIFG